MRKIHISDYGVAEPGEDFTGIALCNGKRELIRTSFHEVNCNKCIRIGYKEWKKHLKNIWGNKVSLKLTPPDTEIGE